MGHLKEQNESSNSLFEQNQASLFSSDLLSSEEEASLSDLLASAALSSPAFAVIREAATATIRLLGSPTVVIPSGRDTASRRIPSPTCR